MELEELGVFSNSYLYNDDYNISEKPGTYNIEEILESISRAGFKFVNF